MKSFKEFYVESTNGKTLSAGKDINVIGNFKDDDKDEILKLMKSFDWYTFAIDDGAQHRAAEASNKAVLNKLKAYGVTKISHDNFSTPMSGKYTKTIEVK